MLITTLPILRCPAAIKSRKIACAGKLSLLEETKKKSGDILFGTILCEKCASIYPILAGVAILVADVNRYLQFHVKGVSALVKNAEIPAPYRASFLEAKAGIQIGHAEEDLESQRINALYYMNHYLMAAKREAPWWRPKTSPHSREIDELIKRFWDRGPFSAIATWAKDLKCTHVIELGCGVGGLARIFSKTAESYLGVDNAFASIALARHVYLQAPYSLPIRVPQDLLLGPLTGKVVPPKLRQAALRLDFVVGEIETLPVAKGVFDLCVALNTIDMIEHPKELPELQFNLLKVGGIAIQSCPYIWHQAVAERLRKSLPKKITSSARAVEHLYQKAGFKIFKNIDHLPWLFLKHFRQIELYSVHLFAARKIKPH
jgi:SAM-dependent methyltransferase/uncharacterized protein YbaR (Trm112 family)